MVFVGLWAPERHLAAHAGVFPSFRRNPPVGWARNGDMQGLTQLMLLEQKPQDHLMVVNISGRGDKDNFTVADHLGGMAPGRQR
jgi:hypothetical protein